MDICGIYSLISGYYSYSTGYIKYTILCTIHRNNEANFFFLKKKRVQGRMIDSFLEVEIKYTWKGDEGRKLGGRGKSGEVG
jgi:hypothetical protein